MGRQRPAASVSSPAKREQQRLCPQRLLSHTGQASVSPNGLLAGATQMRALPRSLSPASLLPLALPNRSEVHKTPPSSSPHSRGSLPWKTLPRILSTHTPERCVPTSAHCPQPLPDGSLPVQSRLRPGRPVLSSSRTMLREHLGPQQRADWLVGSGFRN